MSDDIEMLSFIELVKADGEVTEILTDTVHELEVGDALIDVNENAFSVSSLAYRWLNDLTLVEFVRADEVTT